MSRKNRTHFLPAGGDYWAIAALTTKSSSSRLGAECGGGLATAPVIVSLILGHLSRALCIREAAMSACLGT
jgi:hypothetical protein